MTIVCDLKLYTFCNENNDINIFPPSVMWMNEYKRMLRVDAPTFHYILDAIRLHITKERTHLHRPIYPDEQLLLTLYYLATGKC